MVRTPVKNSEYATDEWEIRTEKMFTLNMNTILDTVHYVQFS
jgi:hypothetical protein